MSNRFSRSAARVAMAGFGLLAGAVAVVPVAVGQGAPTVTGVWLDNDGKAGVEVKPCGAEMCGNIVWLKAPLDPKGKPWTDELNSNVSMRGKPICGLQIIGGLKPAANGLWQGGWIYDPEEGKRFDLELSLENPGTLKVFGYAGVRLLSETMMWKRLAADSARCKQ